MTAASDSRGSDQAILQGTSTVEPCPGRVGLFVFDREPVPLHLPSPPHAELTEASFSLRPGGAGSCSLGREPQDPSPQANSDVPRRGDVVAERLAGCEPNIAPPGHKIVLP